MPARIDRSPAGGTWAEVHEPPTPRLGDYDLAPGHWRQLRIDAALGGLMPTRGRPERIDVVRDGARWTLPVPWALGHALAWHPERPVVAGLASPPGGPTTVWIADHEARSVHQVLDAHVAVSLTGLGRSGRGPLAWCGPDHLAVLVRPEPDPTAPRSVPVPVVLEARGPLYVELAPGADELSADAGVRVHLLEPSSGRTWATGPEGLIDGLEPAADGDRVVAHLVVPRETRVTELGFDCTAIRLDVRDGVEVLVEHPRATTRPIERVGPRPARPPVEGTVHRFEAAAGRDRAQLLVRDGVPGEPALLWIRPCRVGEVPAPASGPVPPLAGDGVSAHLDLPLRWTDEERADSLVEQVRAGVAAALERVRERVGPTSPVLVGGHSFGATVALRALADVPGLDGAIVHSGAYNRTLTPAGFQWEKRTYWQAPEVYRAFSALMFADLLDRPVLVLHGADDRNLATTPDQAIEFYRGLVAAGGHARLVLLPAEGHAFHLPESESVVAAEHRAWATVCAEAARVDVAPPAVPEPV